MKAMIDETELARLEELAGKASLLPWANTDTAKELLNVEPDDWWKIYASNGPEETRFPYHVVCSMSQRATEEEMTAARKAYFYPDGDHIMRDPGKSGDNARYIAAACNAVPALVAEVRRLREALNKEHRAWQCADARGDGLEMENATLREKVEAWEWLFEVEQLYSHETAWCFYQNECALDELFVILTAAREAVHTDR